jgi:uncharacterized protein (DUF1330 family)
MKILAAKTNRYQVLEGAPAEAVVIMEFPSMSDALEWYNSEAYQKALPYRKAAGEYQGFLVEGSS